MHIRKNTWHYRVWSFTYVAEDFIPVLGTKPHYYSPNLCQYVRRILLMTIPVALLCMVATIIACIAFLIWEAILLVSGTGVGLVDKQDMRIYRIPSVPIGRRRVSPQWIALGVWVIGLLWLFGSVIGITVWSGAEWVFDWATWIFWVVGPFVLAIAIVLAVIGLVGFLVSMWRKSETWLLFKAYFKAKKDGICPRLEFTEAETEEANVA